MGKLCKNVKAKAVQFAKDNPMAKPQDYLSTPEGILFKATNDSVTKKDINILKFGNDPIQNTKTSIIFNETTKNLSNKDLVALIMKEEAKILKAVEKPLAELTATGNKIKIIGDKTFRVSHIYSENHIKRGILELGKTPEEIAQKYLIFVKKADLENRLIEDTNTIRTYLDNIPIEVHAHINGDLLQSINFFYGHSKRIVKNLITF